MPTCPRTTRHARALTLVLGISLVTITVARDGEAAPAGAPAHQPPDAPRQPHAVAADTDDSFRAAVRAFAGRSGSRRDIHAWGTARLDRTTKEYRFAYLAPHQTEDGQRTFDAARTGVYVVQQAPDLYWLIGASGQQAGFGLSTKDGPTFDKAGEPEWRAWGSPIYHVVYDTAVHKMSATFGLRGGRWAMLTETYEVEVTNEVHKNYVDKFDGPCGATVIDDQGVMKFVVGTDKSCPPLAQHDFASVDPTFARALVLWWPARSIGELTDVPDAAFARDSFIALPGPEVDHVVPIPGNASP